MLKQVNARHILRCTKGRMRDLRSYNHTGLNNSSSEERKVKNIPKGHMPSLQTI